MSGGQEAEPGVPPDAAQLLAESDLRELELRLRLDAWAEGFAAAAAQFADHYQRGFADGIAAYKAAEHGIVRNVRAELARWDGPREDFGKPRPGDYPGIGAPKDAAA